MWSINETIGGLVVGVIGTPLLRSSKLSDSWVSQCAASWWRSGISSFLIIKTGTIFGEIVPVDAFLKPVFKFQLFPLKKESRDSRTELFPIPLFPINPQKLLPLDKGM